MGFLQPEAGVLAALFVPTLSLHRLAVAVCDFRVGIDGIVREPAAGRTTGPRARALLVRRERAILPLRFLRGSRGGCVLPGASAGLTALRHVLSTLFLRLGVAARHIRIRVDGIMGEPASSGAARTRARAGGIIDEHRKPLTLGGTTLFGRTPFLAERRRGAFCRDLSAQRATGAGTCAVPGSLGFGGRVPARFRRRQGGSGEKEGKRQESDDHGVLQAEVGRRGQYWPESPALSIGAAAGSAPEIGRDHQQFAVTHLVEGPAAPAAARAALVGMRSQTGMLAPLRPAKMSHRPMQIGSSVYETQ